jgi:hypothetical protein
MTFLLGDKISELKAGASRRRDFFLREKNEIETVTRWGRMDKHGRLLKKV